jgi:hypothetical protein
VNRPVNPFIPQGLTQGLVENSFRVLIAVFALDFHRSTVDTIIGDRVSSRNGVRLVAASD